MYNVEKARKAGLNDEKIVKHLAKTRNYDIEWGRKNKYSDAEIIDYLSKQDPIGKPTATPEVPPREIKPPSPTVSSGLAGSPLPPGIISKSIAPESPTGLPRDVMLRGGAPMPPSVPEAFTTQEKVVPNVTPKVYPGSPLDVVTPEEPPVESSSLDPYGLRKEFGLAAKRTQRLEEEKQKGEVLKTGEPSIWPDKKTPAERLISSVGEGLIPFSKVMSGEQKLLSPETMMEVPSAIATGAFMGTVGKGISSKLGPWLRSLTNKERGLVTQSLDDMIGKGYSEGEVLRRWNNPSWREEALSRRMKGEEYPPFMEEQKVSIPKPPFSGGPTVAKPVEPTKPSPIPGTEFTKPPGGGPLGSTILPPGTPKPPVPKPSVDEPIDLTEVVSEPPVIDLTEVVKEPPITPQKPYGMGEYPGVPLQPLPMSGGPSQMGVQLTPGVIPEQVVAPQVFPAGVAPAQVQEVPVEVTQGQPLPPMMGLQGEAKLPPEVFQPVQEVEPQIPQVEGVTYLGVQEIPGQPDQYVFNATIPAELSGEGEEVQDTFYTTDISPEGLAAKRDEMLAKWANPPTRESAQGIVEAQIQAVEDIEPTEPPSTPEVSEEALPVPVSPLPMGMGQSMQPVAPKRKEPKGQEAVRFKKTDVEPTKRANIVNMLLNEYGFGGQRGDPSIVGPNLKQAEDFADSHDGLIGIHPDEARVMLDKLIPRWQAYQMPDGQWGVYESARGKFPQFVVKRFDKEHEAKNFANTMDRSERSKGVNERNLPAEDDENIIDIKEVPQESEEALPVSGEGVKEPWMMTKEEYLQSVVDELVAGGMSPADAREFGITDTTSTGTVTGPNKAHRDAVNNAIRDKLPVPPEVLADYPELQQVAPPETVPQEEPTKFSITESQSYQGQRKTSSMGPNDGMLVAKDHKGTDIGYLWYTKTDGGFTVNKVETDPKYQRQGVASELLAQAEAKMGPSQGATTAQTEKGKALSEGRKKESASELQAEPFQVDDKLTMHSPHSGDDTEVSYRGPGESGKAVVWTGKMQIQVPMEWLSKPGVPKAEGVPEGKPGVEASKPEVAPMEETKPDVEALYDQHQALLQSLPANIGKAKQEGKLSKKQLADLETIDRIEKEVEPYRAEWDAVYKKKYDESVKRQEEWRAERQEVARKQLADSGWAEGDKVSMVAPSMLPTAPGSRHQGVVAIGKNGNIHVRTTNGEHLDLFRNPWEKVESKPVSPTVPPMVSGVVTQPPPEKLPAWVKEQEKTKTPKPKDQMLPGLKQGAIFGTKETEALSLGGSPLETAAIEAEKGKTQTDLFTEKNIPLRKTPRAKIPESVKSTGYEGAPNVIQWLRDQGGVNKNDPSADALGWGIKESGVVGLINQNSKTGLDEYAARWVEEGWAPEGFNADDMSELITNSIQGVQGEPITEQLIQAAQETHNATLRGFDDSELDSLEAQIDEDVTGWKEDKRVEGWEEADIESGVEAYRKTLRAERFNPEGEEAPSEGELEVKWTKAKIVPTREGIKTEVVTEPSVVPPGTTPAAPKPETSTVLESAPPGGFTEADRVPETAPPGFKKAEEPPAQPATGNRWLRNTSTGKYEFYFSKADHANLPKDIKEDIRRRFLWAPSKKAWVSKATKDDYWPKQIVRKLEELGVFPKKEAAVVPRTEWTDKDAYALGLEHGKIDQRNMPPKGKEESYGSGYEAGKSARILQEGSRGAILPDAKYPDLTITGQAKTVPNRLGASYTVHNARPLPQMGDDRTFKVTMSQMEGGFLSTYGKGMTAEEAYDDALKNYDVMMSERVKSPLPPGVGTDVSKPPEVRAITPPPGITPTQPKPEPTGIKAGDRVEYKGREWEVGFRKGDKLRLQESGEAGAAQAHVYVNEVNPIISKPEVPAPSAQKGFSPEIKVQGKWSPNGLVFATEKEAADYGTAKMSTWMMAEDSRVVPADKVPNYSFVNGVLSEMSRAGTVSDYFSDDMKSRAKEVSPDTFNIPVIIKDEGSNALAYIRHDDSNKPVEIVIHPLVKKLVTQKDLEFIIAHEALHAERMRKGRSMDYTPFGELVNMSPPELMKVPFEMSAMRGAEYITGMKGGDVLSQFIGGNLVPNTKPGEVKLSTETKAEAPEAKAPTGDEVGPLVDWDRITQIRDRANGPGKQVLTDALALAEKDKWDDALEKLEEANQALYTNQPSLSEALQDTLDKALEEEKSLDIPAKESRIEDIGKGGEGNASKVSKPSTDTTKTQDDRVLTGGEGPQDVSPPQKEWGTEDLRGGPGQESSGQLRGFGNKGASAFTPTKDVSGESTEPKRGDTEGVGGGHGDVAGLPRHRRGADFRISPEFVVREGSWRDQAKTNLDVIELTKKLDAENRSATPEEQALIAKYTGWGASELANKMFPGYATHGKVDPDYYTYSDKEWKPLVERLVELMTPQEIKVAANSTQFAHYTSFPVIRSIYRALEKFGFAGGRILEPGMGVGSFFGLIPDTMRKGTIYTGIEYDPTTARIAKYLYPHQNIMAEDYTKQKLPNNFFDLSIGNPPFSNTKITADPDYKKFRFNLHEYFFAKSLDKVRPGGILTFITSRYAMDKVDDKVRQYLMDKADLLGAIRLPQTAFKENAGTEVVTDVLFLRKKTPGEDTIGQNWSNLKEIDTPEGKFNINEYFADHPEMILGRNSGQGTMYRANDYTVLPLEGDIEDHFAQAVENLPENVYSITKQPVETQKIAVVERDFNPANRKEGGLYVSDKGEVMIVDSGTGVLLESTKKLTDPDKVWLKGYVGLRDAVKQAQYDQLNEGPWEESLGRLQKAYKEFTKKHGRINEYTTYEGKEEDEDGTIVKVERRRYKFGNLFKNDVEYPLITSLEVETEAGDLVDGPALTGRTLKKPVPPEIKAPSDALAVSLDAIGKLDLDHISQLINKPVEQIVDQLGDLIYRDPSKDTHVLSDEYLSGDVVTKLAEAKTAAAVDPQYQRNVEALIKVQPIPLTPMEVTVNLGAPWVPPEIVTEFAHEVLGLPKTTDVAYNQAGNVWTIGTKQGEATGYYRRRRKNQVLRTQGLRGAAHEWSTGDRGANELLDSVLNNRTIRITRTDADKKTYLDVVATAAANNVAKNMSSRFKTWVWEDVDRGKELLDLWNTTKNNIAPRKFDGSHLTLPGVSLGWKWHPHQLDAIWRIIQSGNTYIAHSVGSGKTALYIAAGMEMKRLGLVNKPMYAVPKSVLQQFANEFQELYPMANIMVADEENFHTDNRRKFIAQATMNAPDAIVLTHPALGLLRMKAENIQPVRDGVLNELRDSLAQMEEEGVGRIRIKQMENRIDKAEQRFDSMIQEGDNVVTFEDMGSDFLFVDEAHNFRKLDFATNRQSKGIDSVGSGRAMDLYIKTKWIDSQKPGRSHVFGSGTPVTNTYGELYTVMRYFAEFEMERDGMRHFDAWASMFGDIETKPEMNSAGRYEMVSRFGNPVNVHELMTRVRTFMDVLTMSQLRGLLSETGRGIPEIRGNQPEIVITPPSDEFKTYQRETLAPRIEASRAWKPSPQQPGNPDPLINIITDGRLASIDMRFHGSVTNNPESKLNKWIDGIIEGYQDTKENTYLDENGKPSDIKGGTIIAFYNNGFGEGVSERRGFDARSWAMKRFKEAGVPTGEIAWFVDYNQPGKKDAKNAMIKEFRNGTKRIMIGSAKTMGVGLNAQRRLAQSHYLDPPWYPADVEQPDGRIIRQGNQNTEVVIKRYATKASYDATQWQMVARKSGAIEKAFTGENVRRLEDISETSQYEMASALAAGDERAIRVAGLRGEIENLRNLQSAHYTDQRSLEHQKSYDESRFNFSKDYIEKLEEARAKVPEYVRDIEGRVGDRDFDSKREFGEALVEAFRANLSDYKGLAAKRGQRVKIGEIRGGGSPSIPIYYAVSETLSAHDESLLLEFTKDVWYNIEKGQRWVSDDSFSPQGLTQKIVNKMNGLDSEITNHENTVREMETELKKIKGRLGTPFSGLGEMNEKVAELTQLENELLAEGQVASGEDEVSMEILRRLNEDYGGHVKRNPDGSYSAFDTVIKGRTFPIPQEEVEGHRSNILQDMEEREKGGGTSQEENPEGGGSPLYSLKPLAPGGKALPLPEIQSQIYTFLKGKPNAPVVKIVPRAEIPSELTRHLPEENISRIEGVYDGKGTVYLAEEAMESKEKVQEVLTHEVVKHYAIEAMLSPDANQFYGEIWKKYGHKGLQDLADDIGADLNTWTGKYTAAREKIAQMDATNEDPGFLKRFYAWIREQVRKVFPSLKITDAEIKTTISRAREFLEKPKPEPKSASRLQKRVSPVVPPGMSIGAQKMAGFQGKASPLPPGFGR